MSAQALKNTGEYNSSVNLVLLRNSIRQGGIQINRIPPKFAQNLDPGKKGQD
jgi:hypothetical protein